MLLGHIEWISALCALLTLICAIQLILAGFLLWIIPDVLILSKSHIPTLAGLIAAFVTLPAVIRFKTARMYPKMYTVYGYTLCYQRLTISVSTMLYLLALLLSIHALVTTVRLGDDFKVLIKEYETKISAKIIVDTVQFVFQCCGGYAYTDWFQNATTKPIAKTEVPLKESANSSSVPYSCCLKSVLVPCRNTNLKLGLDTINKNGCGNKLDTFVHTLLWFEILFYITSFILELGILGLLTEAASEANAFDNSDKTTTSKSGKWGSFTNNNSSISSLWHSSHSEKKVSYHEKR